MRKTNPLFLLVFFFSTLLLEACVGKDARENENRNGSTETKTETAVKTQQQLPDPDNANADQTLLKENLSGNVIPLSSDDFTKYVTETDDPKGFRYKGHTPCVVDFYAGWCGPCMKLKPVLESLAKEYKGKIIVYSVNVDKSQDVCQAFGITNIPTLLFFNRTSQPKKMVGYVSQPELKKTFDEFLSE